MSLDSMTAEFLKVSNGTPLESMRHVLPIFNEETALWEVWGTLELEELIRADD